MRHTLHMHIGRHTRQASSWVQVPAVSLRHQGRIFVVSFIHMFIQVPFRTSECVEIMYVDLIGGRVQVAFAKGDVYEYTHVSRRAIANLLCNPNISLGFWVNHNLLSCDSKTAVWGECKSLPVLFKKEMPYMAA